MDLGLSSTAFNPMEFGATSLFTFSVPISAFVKYGDDNRTYPSGEL